MLVSAPEWHPPLALGESMAVNGVCLTVCEIRGNVFACDILEETIQKTALGRKQRGSHLNLERALAAGERMGGHIVTGHVDGTGIVARRTPAGRDLILRITCGQTLINGMVMKGSVACDGASLTITRISDSSGSARAGANPFFEIHLIPFTLSHTALGRLKTGDEINIETDIIGKYVARLLNTPEKQPRITMNRLREAGFGE